MKRAPPLQRPQAVLFACGLNSVRSPMAAALLRQMLGTKLYVGSAGVRKGELDPFAAAAMAIMPAGRSTISVPLSGCRCSRTPGVSCSAEGTRGVAIIGN